MINCYACCLSSKCTTLQVSYGIDAVNEEMRVVGTRYVPGIVISTPCTYVRGTTPTLLYYSTILARILLGGSSSSYGGDIYHA